MLTFGVTVLPDPPYTRLLELMQMAEERGFHNAWTYDSHILWHESYPLLALAADRTERLKLGHCVTNPGIREPTVTASAYATLQDISGGRMVMAIGRGDSARRYIGQQPVKVAEFERRCAMVRDFMNGRAVHWNDRELQLKWVRPELPEIPLWVAGYGPKALAVAGRIGDGVIIQLADPDIIQWIMGTARAAAEEAGRDPAKIGRSTSLSLSEPWDEVRSSVEQLAAVGVSYLTVSWPSEGRERLEEFVERVMPELRALEPEAR